MKGEKPQMKKTSLADSVSLFQLTPTRYISIAKLKELLPDAEHVLWFAKLLKLSHDKLSHLLWEVCRTSVVEALMAGDHSTELQDYLVDTVPPEVWPETKPDFVEAPRPAQILPHLWEDAFVEVAKSIQDVADKLVSTLELLPSKQGKMVFSTLAQLNKQRPSIGVHKARIQHAPVPDVLVILDVSGSMTQTTVRAIIEDVVALSWKANAHLAIVSDSTFHWEPGSYNVDDVLGKAEYSGTHYETLAPLFNKDWGTVVTIADYDSASSAKTVLAKAKGSIGVVLDISLVNRSTYLAECVGQLANEVRPLLIGQNYYVTRY